MLKYKPEDMALFDALVTRLQEVYKENPSDENIFIHMTKEEILPIVGDIDLLNESCSNIIRMRYEDDCSIASVCNSVSWQDGVLTAEFNRYAVPYLLKYEK